MEQLTVDEIETLVEAVEAWEGKDAADMLSGSMLGIMMAKDAESAKKYAEEEQNKYMQGNEKRKLKKERAILLKAKLIKLKDSLIAQDLAK